MSVLITICARGGSKGIPGKNIKPINGIPLLEYSLRVANLFRAVYPNTQIVLSTDSESIKACAEQSNYKIETDYVRPEVLATDTAGKLDAIIDVLKFAEAKHKIDFDFIIDLDVTSPLRSLSDLEKAMEMIVNDSEAYNIFSVNYANRNPYFNMVEQKENGYYSTIKKGEFLTRQSAPPVYDMNASFYIYKKSFFELGMRSAITEKSLIYVMDHVCFDLDHPLDFEFMEYLMTNDKLDFKL